MKPIIEIAHLSKRFGDLEAVRDLSFTVREGELFAFLGVNGAGKSTTISILCGRLRQDAGEVRIGGWQLEREGAAIKARLGVVFQNSALDKALTVLDNLRSRAALYGITGEAFRKRLEALDELLELKPLLRRPVGKLSGGQRRRADIARALLHAPAILILDEPTNHLDINSREVLEDALTAFEGTIIAVSHDRYFINKLATRILDFGAESNCHLFAFEGSYNQYIEYKKKYLSKPENDKKETTITTSKEQYLNTKREMAEHRKSERLLRNLKEDIGITEKQISEVNEEINTCDAYNHIHLAALEKKLTELEDKLLSLYEKLDVLEGL